MSEYPLGAEIYDNVYAGDERTINELATLGIFLAPLPASTTFVLTGTNVFSVPAQTRVFAA